MAIITASQLLTLDYLDKGVPFVNVAVSSLPNIEGLDILDKGTPFRATELSVTFISRPSSDSTTTGWTSTAGTFWSTLDEESANDSDYVTSPDIGAGYVNPLILGLNRSLPAGNYNINVRAKYLNILSQFKIVLLDDSNVEVGQSSWQEVSSSYSTYQMLVSPTDTATKIKIVVSLPQIEGELSYNDGTLSIGDDRIGYTA